MCFHRADKLGVQFTLFLHCWMLLWVGGGAKWFCFLMEAVVASWTSIPSFQQKEAVIPTSSKATPISHLTLVQWHDLGFVVMMLQSCTSPDMGWGILSCRLLLVIMKVLVVDRGSPWQPYPMHQATLNPQFPNHKSQPWVFQCDVKISKLSHYL